MPFFQHSDNVPFFVVLLLICTLGFIGNIVTVAVISCWRKLHTPTFTMITCLAVSDAYSLLIFTMDTLTNIQSFIACTELEAISSLSSFPVKTVTSMAFISLARYNGGMQLCLLAFLRFTAIVYPHKYQAYCTCKAVIVMSVVSSVIIFISFAIEHSVYFFVDTSCNVFEIPMYSMNFIVPTTVFISLHCLKLRALRRSPSLNRISSLRMNVVLIILMSIYVISSASGLISKILFCQFSFVEFEHLGYIRVLSFLFNCAVNPFVYFFSSPAVVQLFGKMWHRLFKRCQVTDNGIAQEMEMNNIPTA